MTVCRVKEHGMFSGGAHPFQGGHCGEIGGIRQYTSLLGAERTCQLRESGAA